MRARAGLHGLDAVHVQHAGPAQEVRVLGGVDVVGDDGEVHAAAQRPAQGGGERGLAAADRSADADPDRAVVVVVGVVVVAGVGGVEVDRVDVIS
ncbi:hypothetical protein GCM10010492_14270 [Saccharothrix mutabilis subsp. mutabilis]|uniref:Uncharacterized protein n=1 Tax=Saccharothrix mutabilis subsp. mutabilis TaxID=66855 RepID=A0ABN0TBT5_9PSEU